MEGWVPPTNISSFYPVGNIGSSAVSIASCCTAYCAQICILHALLSRHDPAACWRSEQACEQVIGPSETTMPREPCRSGRSSSCRTT